MGYLTTGETRLRIDFDKHDKTLVNLIKSKTAGLINIMESLTVGGDMIAAEEAKKAYEVAAMWAEKAVKGQDIQP